MKTFKDLNKKEKLEYIGIMAIYPLILLYGQIGKSFKFLNSKARQITASVLTVCLMLTMIPVMSITAFAAPSGSGASAGDPYVVTSGADFKTALESTANTTNYIRLGACISLSGYTAVSNSVVVDLNGYTINTESDGTYISGSQTMTFKNGYVKAGSKAFFNSASNNTGPDYILENLIVTNANDICVYVGYSGTLNATNCSFTTAAVTPIDANRTGAKFTLTDCYLQGNSYAYKQSYNTLTIDGRSITGNASSATYDGGFANNITRRHAPVSGTLCTICDDVDSHNHDEVIFEPWTATSGNLTGGNYYLTESNATALTDDITIPENATVNLCLNGHTLDLGSKYIKVTSGATLNVCDCAQTAGGVTSSNTSFGAVYINGGKVKITAGSITGTSCYGVYLAGGDLDLCGSGIVSAGSESLSDEVYGIINKGSGTVNIYGDAQVRAKSQTYVYGVCNYYNSGAMNIYGNAKVSATDGRSPSHGVYNYANSGTVNIYDNAEITATGNYTAYGVRSYDGTCAINIYGSAKIISTGQSNTYGVYNDSNGDLSVSGNAELSATGTYNVDGIYISTGTVDISGSVKVSATSTGGRNIAYGVRSGYSTGTVSISENVTITATGSSYGVFNSGTAYISGGTISGDRYGIYNFSGSKIFLSGSSSISGDDTNYADICCADTAIFYATKGEAALEGEAYTGGALTLEHDGSKGTVAVYNSTDTNKFSLVNNTNGYILAADNGNLILAVPHTHSWATDWTDNATHHWHECENADCTVTVDSQKNGYGEHTALADDGNCLTAVLCSCGKEMVAAKAEHVSTGDNAATYTKKAICDTCSTEYGDVVPDNIKPTLQIKQGTNVINRVLNTITFGLFFKETKEITIVPKDNETGIDKTYYFVSDKAPDAGEIKNISWKEYTGEFSLNPNSKNIIYAYTVDESGNESEIYDSNGIVLYTDARTVDTENTYKLTTEQNKRFYVTHNGNTIEAVSLGNTVLTPNTHYRIANYGAENCQIVMYGTYLDTLTAGSHTFTVTYKPLGEAYVEAEGNEKPATTEFTVKVEKEKIDKPQKDTNEFTYNGQEQAYTVAESEYYTVSGDKRTNAGEQDVIIALKDKNKTCWADNSTDDLKFEFKIGKVTPNMGTVTVTAPEHIYFNTELNNISLGRTDTTVSGSLKLNGGQVLTIGTKDYDWSFKPNDTVNYEGVTGKVSITVSKIKLNVEGISWNTADSPFTYDGTKKSVALNGTLPTGVVVDKSGNTAINAGSYTATAAFKLAEGYSSTNYEIIGATDNKITANWSINPKVVVPTIIISPESYTYTGEPIIPSSVTVNDGGAVIPANEYDIDYSNNINAGTATVTITDKTGGNYTVNGTEAYTIGKADPKIDFPTDLSISTGKKLSEIALSLGFTWDNPDTVVTYGINKYDMTYTYMGPNASNYNPVSEKVEVEGLDPAPPTATVQIGVHTWTQRVDKVFNLFFNGEQTVTVTANDTESGVEKMEYHLATDKLISFSDIEWTAFTDSFKLSTDTAYVVYVKLTDNVGNTHIIGTHRIVIDSVKPIISGIEDGKDVYGDATFTVQEDYLDTITLDGDPISLKDGKYTILADNKEHTVVVTDKSGNTVTYKFSVYKNYKVSFVADGKEISSSEVGYGKDATLPKIPKKHGYTAKWDADGKSITADTVITAIYEKIPKSPQTDEKTSPWILISALILSGASIITVAKKRKEIK